MSLRLSSFSLAVVGQSDLRTLGRLAAWLWLGSVLGMASVSAASAATLTAAAYRADRILIQPKGGGSLSALARFHSAHQGQVLHEFEGMGGLQVVAIPKGESVPGMLSKYRESGLVAFAEPDYTGQASATAPNDPKFVDGTLWGLNKIDAPGGWDLATSASNIVVAVLDTGVRLTHEDLAANLWVNPHDGSHGLNALTGTTDPSDDSGNGHGTMVAGVLGAVGNNGKGVAGVAWRVQIIACKCVAANLAIHVSDCITCLDYARTNQARLINASWGFPTNSLALSNALDSLRIAGIILVAASGNSAADLDINPTYPSGYHLDNVVSVAATTNTDALSSYSNYGATTVHLAAPGDKIYSTFPATDNFYYTESGTSFAAPYVTGALALMLARYPTETYQQIIGRLLHGTDQVPALAGKCATGGRLNLRKALSPVIRLTPLAAGEQNFQARISYDPNQTVVIQAATDAAQWSPVFTNTTTASGTFDFTDLASPNFPHRFYRALAPP